MARINSYPLVETVEDGDSFLAYRQSNGRTIRIPKSVLSEAIATTFLQLEDTPGTYVGQSGRTLVVNSAEDGLEFTEAAAPSSYLGLTDTPVSFSGQGLKRPIVNSGETAIEFTSPTFLEGVDVPDSYAGLAGSLLRVTDTEDGLEFFPDTGDIPDVVLVRSEDDLPEVNGSGEHELLADTTYWFLTSFTLANPIRFVATTTEVYGNGIGNTKITYTGSGYAVRATNGAASIRLRYLQIISSTGDGFEFVGSGNGSGTNVSLDRAYFICSSGKIGTVQSVDIFFADASVLLGSSGVTFSGSDNGLFYSGTSRYQSSAATTLIDFNSCVFQVISAVVLDFRGVAGTFAIGGDGEANIATGGSGQFNSCTLEGNVQSFSGTLDSTSLKWAFTGNTGIPDSNSVAFAYIDVPATTNIVDGGDVPIAGTWAQHPNTERATVDATGEITFLNTEEVKGQALITLSANKLGGTIQNYDFKLQKDSGSGYSDVLAANKIAAVDSGGRSITLFGLVQYVDGDSFRLVVEGVGTSDDIDVTVTQFIIG